MICSVVAHCSPWSAEKPVIHTELRLQRVLVQKRVLLWKSQRLVRVGRAFCELISSLVHNRAPILRHVSAASANETARRQTPWIKLALQTLAPLTTQPSCLHVLRRGAKSAQQTLAPVKEEADPHVNSPVASFTA